MSRKQLEIAGTERASKIDELDVAAEKYVEARDKRMSLTKKEIEQRSLLISAMQKHKLEVYEDTGADPPLLVTLSEKLEVKVKNLNGEEEAA